MTATLLSEVALPALPSASGVEIIGPTAYVIGDDAPLLYQLDAHTLAVTGRVPLFETTAFGTGRLPKADKPDLECMAALTWPDGRPGLLLLGSGSLPTRARGWFVPTAPAAPVPETLNLAPLYELLRLHLPTGAVLNLEAAATSETELLLFQRTVGRADAALLFRLPLAGTLAFMQGQGAAPAVQTTTFALPEIDGRPAGFSGATFVDSLLFVTASVEDTADAVLDGAVLGSFVGLVNLQTQKATFSRLAWADGRPYRGKVEGLAVRRSVGQRHWELLLVTDDDQGGSTAVVVELTLD
ncbi:DUF6929 family protein [Hymenobacter properus]|uniref:Uncharacterized protein n=1 Tax=Hymenobacter properus TaxID=2791026 RepID=A0A931FJN5_9BACT|nr:hypothetical protein [Hymenobacter properus]MBF9140191.1 hypothetical protein [Hymenobacter properus]MBR7718998.1 hypothetical protein [Microvirga sp. SRT04]